MVAAMLEAATAGDSVNVLTGIYGVSILEISALVESAIATSTGAMSGLIYPLAGMVLVLPLNGQSQSMPIAGLTESKPLDGKSQTYPLEGFTQTYPG